MALSLDPDIATALAPDGVAWSAPGIRMGLDY